MYVVAQQNLSILEIRFWKLYLIEELPIRYSKYKVFTYIGTS